jgi:membrane protein implicated in regulation of membrane protease activity
LSAGVSALALTPAPCNAVEVDVAPGGLFWWIGAGVLIVLELMSGTFYLLMIALGFVAAALARLSGANADVQFALAALVALAAVLLLRPQATQGGCG